MTSRTTTGSDALIASGPKPETARTCWLLSFVILLGGILTIVLALYMVVVSYSSLPYSDGWTQISVAANGENPLSPAWLWRQHNEHRLLIPKLFLALDLRWLQARQVFLLASIFAIQFLHWGLLSWSMWVLGGWRGALWRTGVGLAAFCLFCPSQWENLVWGFQVCFVLPGLFATLSFVGLLLYWLNSNQQSGNGRSLGFLLVSVAAALGATYSLANGNLLWPLLVAAALFLRLRWPAVLSFGVIGCISTAFYFHQYIRPPQHADPLSSMRSPAKIFEYLATYFGSSWVLEREGLASLLGIASMVIALAVMAVVVRRGSNAFSVQLVLTSIFCLGTAVLTALGRVNLGLMQAFSSRYQSVALLFWCCLGLMFLLLASTSRHARVAVMVAQICLLAILLRGASLARYPIRQARMHGFQLNAAAVALATGVDDQTQLQFAFPQPDYVLKVVPYMREKRLSVFSGVLPAQLGRPLDSVFASARADECIGAVQSLTPIDGGESRGLRITGWAWDYTHRRPPIEIVATTDGIITGLGAIGDWRPAIRATKPWMNTSFIGFDVYVQDGRNSAPLNLYAVLQTSPPSACYFVTP